MATKKVASKIRSKKKNKSIKDSSSDLADILFPNEDEENFSEDVMSLPPEQRRLHTDTYDFSISSILSHLGTGHIFVPEFQRQYVWDNMQASRLIESLIIQCPIPVLYFSQTIDEKFSVIDGNQRINSIKRFLKNEFILKGLTAYPELDGKKFSELDPRFQRHILNRTLRCIVILKETHPQVKFDVFERLNTGSVKLTPQELRHGLYQCELLKRIEKLSKNKKFTKLLPPKFSKRMRTEELILKYLALSNNMSGYYQPVSGFLNDFLQGNKELSSLQLDKMENDFISTFSIVYELFGEKSFKTQFKEGRSRNRFLVAVFDAQMLAAKKFKQELHSITTTEKNQINKNVAELFVNQEFVESVTKATPNKNAMLFRIKKMTEALKL